MLGSKKVENEYIIYKKYKIRFNKYGEIEYFDLNGKPLSEKKIIKLVSIPRVSLRNRIKSLIQEIKKAKHPIAHIKLAQGENWFRVSNYYNSLKVLKRLFGIKKSYYPGSNNDITPALVFDESIILNIDRLTHANFKVVLENDKLKKRLQELIGKKIQRVILKRANAHKFKPSKDTQLLLLINFTDSSDEVLKMFRGDYIACNNYTGTAFNISLKDEYQLIGRVTNHGIAKPDIKTGIPLVKQIKFGTEPLWLFKKKNY